MTSAQLQQWIQHPELLDRDSLYELRTQMARYPYFQSLHLLYLKNLYLLHDASFGAELRKAVLYVADRRLLFSLIEGDHYLLQPHKSTIVPLRDMTEEPGVDRTLFLIDAFLSSMPEEQQQQSQSVPMDLSMDYTAYLLQDEEEFTEDNGDVRLRGQELIDGFLNRTEREEQKTPIEEETKGTFVENEELLETKEKPVLKMDPEEEEEEDSADTAIVSGLDDNYFTETLAKIYIKQHRYEKALEIIKKLSLNYPKKNAYFADQIRFLLLTVLMLLASVLMCFIVLIQNSKGGGLASGFSSSNQIMGVRKTTDFLEKTTWTLAAVMVVFSIAAAYALPSATAGAEDVIMEQAQQQEATNPYNMPIGTAAPQTDAPATTAPAAADSAAN